jgi:uncharacterized membrane protein
MTWSFLRDTLIQGLFVFLPIGVLVFILERAFSLIQALSTTLGGKLLEGHWLGIPLPVLTAIALLILIVFVLGLFSGAGGNLASDSWLERNLLQYIPGYSTLRATALATFGQGAEGALQPAVLRREEGVEELVLIVEELPGDRYTLFLPESPSPTTGTLLIVKRELVEPLDGKLLKTLQAFRHMGLGAGNIAERIRR